MSRSRIGTPRKASWRRSSSISCGAPNAAPEGSVVNFSHPVIARSPQGDKAISCSSRAYGTRLLRYARNDCFSLAVIRGVLVVGRAQQQLRREAGRHQGRDQDLDMAAVLGLDDDVE